MEAMSQSRKDDLSLLSPIDGVKKTVASMYNTHLYTLYILSNLRPRPLLSPRTPQVNFRPNLDPLPRLPPPLDACLFKWTPSPPWQLLSLHSCDSSPYVLVRGVGRMVGCSPYVRAIGGTLEVGTPDVGDGCRVTSVGGGGGRGVRRGRRGGGGD